MKCCAASCVKNSHILLSASIQHLALNGIEDFYIYDHGSNPDLPSFFEHEFKFKTIRLHIIRKESEAFFQREMIHVLTTLARADGFEVVVAFDADEFWCSTAKGISLIDQIAHEFREGPDALRVPVINYAQHGAMETFQRDSLSRCQYSVIPIRDDTQHPRDQVASGVPFLAMPFPSKVITRLSPDIKLTTGQHDITKTTGQVRVLDASNLVVRHLPLPSKAHLSTKREEGLRLIAGGYSNEIGWQSQRLAQASDDELTAYWENNSWSTAEGQPVSVGAYAGIVFDTALVQIGKDLAAERSGKHPISGSGISDAAYSSGIPANQLERVVQSLVDDRGVAERVIENLHLALARATSERDQALFQRRPLLWRLGAAGLKRLKPLERRIRHFWKRI